MDGPELPALADTWIDQPEPDVWDLHADGPLTLEKVLHKSYDRFRDPNVGKKWRREMDQFMFNLEEATFIELRDESMKHPLVRMYEIEVESDVGEAWTYMQPDGDQFEDLCGFIAFVVSSMANASNRESNRMAEPEMSVAETDQETFANRLERQRQLRRQ